MNRVILALGSNVGDRETHIEKAIEMIATHEMVELHAVATLFANPAQAVYAQPDFLNTCIEISTWLIPEELLDLTETIEREFGRKNKGGQDPRTLDIDIIFYADQIISSDRLLIPHPLMHQREFVLKPLSEIAKDWVHPMLQMTVEQMYRTVMR